VGFGGGGGGVGGDFKDFYGPIGGAGCEAAAVVV
jgi:hypothetical protein